MKKLCIVGAGGTAKDLLELVACTNKDIPLDAQWQCIGILDDNKALQGGEYAGIPVIGELKDAPTLDDDVRFAFVVGSPRTVGKRQEIFRKLGVEYKRFPSFIHPKAVVENSTRIGAGCIVFAGVVISGTAALGNFNIILPNSVVNHDSVLNDFTCMASSVCVSGDVHVGSDCYIGALAALRDGITLESAVLVGMSSAVVCDVSADSVVCGVPAKPKD